MSEEESTLNLQVRPVLLCTDAACSPSLFPGFQLYMDTMRVCPQALQEACPNSPWRLTFSYGRALQNATLKVRAGTAGAPPDARQDALGDVSWVLP